MIDEMCSLQTMVPGSPRLWDAFDHAQQAARVFKNRSSLRSTLLEAPSVLQPNYEWMSVIDSRACWNIGNGQRVKMLGDNWFLGQVEFEVWSPTSTLVIRLIEDDANNGNLCRLPLKNSSETKHVRPVTFTMSQPLDEPPHTSERNADIERHVEPTAVNSIQPTSEEPEIRQ
ncbi:hypothetical protein KIW84_061734 [Lathyrus oleraceus]|uniref:Uncharacterized protein n=1 Tax=Pisum sativum TaxID=3888 RepID=A0A9D4W6G9_PEA|nr:hypothetical protein KIW84_061734 [Pisum sativum]